MNVVTQPYARPPRAESDNFAVTMLDDYDLAGAVQRAGAEDVVELSAYLRFHPSGRSRIWAIRNSRSRSVWRKMRKDDLVLFHGHSEVYAYGYVTAKVYWPDNDVIWPSGDSWDHIYALRDVTVLPAGQRPEYQALKTALPRFVGLGVHHHDVEGRPVDELLRPVFTDGYVPAADTFTPPEPPAARPPSTADFAQPPEVPETGDIGRDFSPPTFTELNAEQETIDPNWKAVERGTLAHQQIITALAQLVEAVGLRPTEGPSSVAFDLGWGAGDRYVVGEVKSLTQANEANQIRLGLGQVLDYRHALARRRDDQEVVAALVLEQAPVNKRWVDVCASVGVRLAWPETMAAQLAL